MKWRQLGFGLACTAALSCLGCRWGTPPDPNNPATAGIQRADVLRSSLKGASDALLERVAHGELTDAQFKKQIAIAANEILKGVQVDQIPISQAWEYGELFRTARQWEVARKLLETAVKVAKTNDRRVNDSLHLAHVYAELDQVPKAIQTARSVFDVPNKDAAPILPAVLLEIVPAGQHKGSDPELAALLRDAIDAENRTVVDPSTQPGIDFLAAKRFHLKDAWKKIAQLYKDSGKPEEAAAASKAGNEMLQNYARV